MTALQERILKIRNEIPESVQLIAVSKFHPIEQLLEAYDAGQRIFGESKVQELNKKQALMPPDTEWHFIGHLQTNKVKYIAPYVAMIHAVDSLNLLCEINKQAARYNRIIPCLLQIHVAREESKFGFSPLEFQTFLNDGKWCKLHNVKISGLMCMASFTDDVEQIAYEFRTVTECFNWAKEHHFAKDNFFSHRSWGMSNDYRIAINEGSNMVRIGSYLFGHRS